MPKSMSATLDRAWRRASRPVLPVTFSGTFAEAGTMTVSGPGQKRRARHVEAVIQFARQLFCHHGVPDQDGQRAVRLAAFGLKHLRHRAQIERIGYQGIERVRGDGDHFAPSHGGGGTLQSFLLGLVWVDFDQVGSH